VHAHRKPVVPICPSLVSAHVGSWSWIPVSSGDFDNVIFILASCRYGLGFLCTAHSVCSVHCICRCRSERLAVPPDLPHPLEIMHPLTLGGFCLVHRKLWVSVQQVYCAFVDTSVCCNLAMPHSTQASWDVSVHIHSGRKLFILHQAY